VDFDSPSGQNRAKGEGKGETRNKEKEKEGWGQKRWIHGLRCGSGGRTGALRELEARNNLDGSFYEKTRGARKKKDRVTQQRWGGSQEFTKSYQNI